MVYGNRLPAEVNVGFSLRLRLEYGQTVEMSVTPPSDFLLNFVDRLGLYSIALGLPAGKYRLICKRFSSRLAVHQLAFLSTVLLVTGS